MSTKQPASEILYLRLSEQEADAVKRLAETNVRTLTAEIRVAVRQYIEANADKIKPNGATH